LYNQKQGIFLSYVEGWLAIVVNILLFILKYWAGIVTGSLAIIADAWHTLSDSFTSLVVIVGAKASVKPPDEKHPFGHGRSELIASLVISVILAVVALDFFTDACQRLSHHKTVVYGDLAKWVTAISVAVKEMMAWFAFWSAKKTGSAALKADAWHHRSDALSSLVILAGIFLGSSFWWMDSAMAFMVSAMLFHASYSIFREVLDPLIGDAPRDETTSSIKKIIKEVSGKDLSPHHFHVHRYGAHTELTFHITFPGSISLFKAHSITTDIENEIKNRMGMYVTIHMEPEEES